MNKFVKKVELTPFSDESRAAWLALTGLSKIEFDILEVCDRLVLSAKRYRGQKVSTRLNPLSAGQLVDISQSNLRKTLVMTHPGPSLYRHPSHPAVSLWEELFPAPWSQWVPLFRSQNGISVRAFPADFEKKLQELWLCFERIDDLLRARDLSCLCFTREEFSLPILFHYIRGRRIQVRALGNVEAQPAAAPTRQLALTSVLGQVPEWFEINISNSDDPISHLIECLQSTLHEVDQHGPSEGLTELPTIERLIPPFPFPI
jgi:hypothetical protein